MSEPVVFAIEDGVIAFALVDTSAVGYSAAWQAPGGAAVDEVTLGDYEAQSVAWSCQQTSGVMSSSQSTTTTERKATFCRAAATIPNPGETAYSLELQYYQDPNVAAGFSAFLFANDTREAYVLFGMDGDNPPRAIGRVRLGSGDIGGAARTPGEATISLPFVRKPDVEFGNATSSIIVTGAGIVPTTAVAGAPGTFTPSGAYTPFDGAEIETLTASPSTEWTEGQYVEAQNGDRRYWDGDSWEDGEAPGE